jgi:hypothetical protein
MRRLLSLFPVLFCLAALAQAQTTVTATVTDSDGIAWANGLWSVTYQQSPGFPGVLTNSLTGQVITQPTLGGSLDGRGSFSVNLIPSISVIGANGSSPGVIFTVCPQSITGAPCYSTPIISIQSNPASQSVSSQIAAAIHPIRLTGSTAGSVFAYADAEVTGSTGTRYFRLSDDTQRCWSSGAWSACGGSGVVVPTISTLGFPSPINWQGTTFENNTTAGVQIGDPLQSSTFMEGIARSYPTPPFTFDAELSVPPQAGSGGFVVGIGATSSLTGQMEEMEYHLSSGTPTFDVQEWTSPSDFNGFNSGIASVGAFYTSAVWLRYHDDGTNLTWSYSTDGANWFSLGTEAKSSAFLHSSGYNYIAITFSSWAMSMQTVIQQVRITNN